MNPMTNIKNTQKISEREIQLGRAGTKNSWHSHYKDSAWIFVGGLPYDLTEGDVICVFSQCGEIVNCNMVRDQKTGKSKGFMFICFEDQRSTTLAVDNLNGIKLLNRSIRVDHVLDYKPPKEHENEDDVTRRLRSEGCAPQMELSCEEEVEEDGLDEKKPKNKKKKKEKKKKRKSPSVSKSDSETKKKVKKELSVKKEKIDPGYGDLERSDQGSSRHDNGMDYRHSNQHTDDRGDASPKRRGPSPRKRSRSPRRRVPSPRQRNQSPRQRDQSSRQRDQSPRQRDQSPRQRDQSPRQRDQSPRQRDPSPKRRSKSPRSPRRRVPSPRRRSRSPRRRSRSPRRRSRSPADRYDRRR